MLSATFDGGALWTQLLPAPAPAGQVDAVSSRTAVGAQDPADAGAVLRSDDGGRGWRPIAHLPGVVTWLDFWSASDGVAATSVNGHGLLLTLAGGTPWEADSGGSAPVRIWTTSNNGLNWARGSLLPLGRDWAAGPASFAPYPGSVPGGPARWSGWLVVEGASGAQRVAVIAGGPLRLLPATVPAGSVQLIGPGTGLAWSLDYPGSPSAPILSLARTTDSGRRWIRA